MIYKLVSSAKRRIEEFMFLTILFIKMRKSRGPSIEPCGTPAYTDYYCCDRLTLIPGSIRLSRPSPCLYLGFLLFSLSLSFLIRRKGLGEGNY